MSGGMSPIVIKSLVAAGTAGALDKFLIGEPDLTQNALFAASVGGGVYLGSMVSNITPALLPDNLSATIPYTGSKIMEQTFDVGASAGIGYLLTKYGTLSEPKGQMYQKLGVSLISIAVGEYVRDFLNNEPLQVFA